MTKERQSSREARKKPAMTLKEKRNLKKSRREARSTLGVEKPI